MTPFRVVQCDVVGRLVSKLGKAGTMLKYLADEELFNELHELHVEKGHAGRDIMKAAVIERFSNVTQKTIMSFLACCESCLNICGKAKEGLVVKPILSKEARSRMHVKQKTRLKILCLFCARYGFFFFL